MKALFIDNHIGFYGAQKSLIAFLENDDKFEKAVVYPKAILFQKFKDYDKIKKKLEARGILTYQFYLPLYKNYKGAPTTFRFKIANFVRNFLWKIHKRKLYDFIKKENFDFIHLNSLTLWDIVNHNFNYFCHARELLSDKGLKDKNVIKKLNICRGIIFIDEATRIQFENNLTNPKIANIENPIDMTNVLKHINKKDEIKRNYGIEDLNAIIISIIGKIREFKGVDLIIKSFNEFSQNENSYLLIVGDGDKNYIQKCKSMSKTKRILFVGEEPEIEKIYAITDIVARGEPEFCIGRTVYEGLFSGCLALQPGTYDDVKKHPEIFKFSDKIFLYEPANVDDLTKAMMRSANYLKTSKVERNPGGNAKDYAEKLAEYFIISINKNKN